MSSRDDLHRIRRRWEDSVQTMVRELWPPGADSLVSCPAGEFDARRALVASFTAMFDLEGLTAIRIARRLMSNGLVTGADAGDVVTLLVEPIIDKVRRFGMPQPRWWDIAGWNRSLHELSALGEVMTELDYGDRCLQIGGKVHF